MADQAETPRAIDRTPAQWERRAVELMGEGLMQESYLCMILAYLADAKYRLAEIADLLEGDHG